MAVAARKLTYGDFLRLPEDGNRREIVGGEEFVAPAPVRSSLRIAPEGRTCRPPIHSGVGFDLEALYSAAR